MGRCVGLLAGNETIKKVESKKNEFATRIEKLFQIGGMMKIEEHQMFGECVYTIHVGKMNEKGIDFIYNYFEEDFWENAGFNKKTCKVYSGKIGYSCFAEVVIAAYVLEVLYNESFAVVDDEEEKGVDQRRYINWINNIFNDNYYEVNPVSTMEFLQKDVDEMIYYWNSKWKLKFTKEMYSWFDEIKCKYEKLMSNDEQSINQWFGENKQKYIMDLMKEAEYKYYRIFTFTDFFEETIENITDKRFLVLWKIYEEFIRDSELEKIGNVIYAQEENTLFERRRLKTSWMFMPLKDINNKARLILRRYMALVANKELRKEVLGF